MDNELIEAISKLENNKKESAFLEEHRFVANCLQIGLRIEDLKQMEYKDVAKILISSLPQKQSKYKKATQADWDRLI